MHSKLRELDRIEAKAFRAKMNDPRCLADPRASHTPEIEAAYEAAALACWNYRNEHGLLGHRGY